LIAPEFASVAVARPVRNQFTYLVPPPLAGALTPGRRVVVPFGAGRAVGFYIGPSAAPPRGALKPVAFALDDGPVFSEDLLRFLSWISEYYRYPLGETMRAALPPGLSEPRELPPERRDIVQYVSLVKADAELRGVAMRAVVDYLKVCGRVSMDEVASAIPGARDPVKRLFAQGVVAIDEELRSIDRPERTLTGVRPTQLTSEQEKALAEINRSIESSEFAPFLLQGVTGSGKTEVYLRAIEEVRRRGRGALCVVPEIALTPLLVGRFRDRFGADIAVLHSGLRERERLLEWRRLRDDRARIAVGVRSAVFAPVRDLGIVVVDEEHDASFKQEEKLRYHARDAAVMRAKLAGCPVILGSATPSLESVENARQGRYRLIRLDRRIDSRPMPSVTVVDMRRQATPIGDQLPMAAEDRAPRWSGPHTDTFPKGEGGNGSPERPLLSFELAQALAEVLESKQQAILLLNRRGLSTFHLCSTCGLVLRCPNCSVALTYHLARRSLLCHYCAYSRGLPDKCSECRGPVVHFGVGTERVQEEVIRRFPRARVERLDRDSTKGARELTSVLTRFGKGEIDVLVGTQMLAKGHDFPGITLVGVVLADIALHLPDFRSGEHTFQLLTQVAGRAGRGDAPGRVLVQTYNPATDAVARVVGHDFDGFAEAELARRKALFFPPYARLAAVRLDGRDVSRTMQGARLLAEAASVPVRTSRGQLRMLGPSPAAMAKVRGRFRWQILLKGPTSRSLVPAMEAVEVAMRKLPTGVRAVLDVDPVDLL
jgi:primosomal protein N' (replication factor Y) (superfamily II helicase)